MLPKQSATSSITIPSRFCMFSPLERAGQGYAPIGQLPCEPRHNPHLRGRQGRQRGVGVPPPASRFQVACSSTPAVDNEPHPCELTGSFFLSIKGEYISTL